LVCCEATAAHRCDAFDRQRKLAQSAQLQFDPDQVGRELDEMLFVSNTYAIARRPLRAPWQPLQAKAMIGA